MSIKTLLSPPCAVHSKHVAGITSSKFNTSGEVKETQVSSPLSNVSIYTRPSNGLESDDFVRAMYVVLPMEHGPHRARPNKRVEVEKPVASAALLVASAPVTH